MHSKFYFFLSVSLLFTFYSLLLSPYSLSPAFAASPNSYVTIVNPVRGNDFWSLKDQEPVTSVTANYQNIQSLKLPATWLLRYDAMTDQKIVDATKAMNDQQELGLFLEVTPSLAKAASVNYRVSEVWHRPGSVFLTAYTQEERKKLIDAEVKKFQEIYGKKPKAVGAWWIDAYSLSYLKDQYGIEAAMIVADQYSTDNYQIWGQYWALPYYPSKVNALMPASDKAHQLDIVMTQWAARDPFNGYGNGVFESTFSVQVNDYEPYHHLGIDYFDKLVSLFTSTNLNKIGQVTIGLENDYSLKEFGPGYAAQLQSLSQSMSKGQLQATTMTGFAQAFKTGQPINVPNVVASPDLAGGDGYTVWYMSPYYRVGWFVTERGSVIRDMRLYFDSKEEPCFKIACKTIEFAYTDSKALDEVTFGDQWLIDEKPISDVQVSRDRDIVIIHYKNKAGLTREIKFSPHDVSIEGQTQSAATTIMRAIELNQQGGNRIQASEQSAQLPLKRLGFGFLTLLLVLVVLVYLPARGLVRKAGFSFSGLQGLAIETSVGLSLLTILAYISHVVRLGQWYLVLLGATAMWTLIKYQPKIRIFRPNKSDFLVAGSIILGSIILTIPVIRSGLPMRYGLGFWGPNGHDAIWHLALIESLKQSVPPQNPIFAGVPLQNYHYFFDLLIAQLAWISRADTLDIFFRFMPVLLALLYGCLLYGFTKSLNNRTSDGLYAVILGYVAGSFGWIGTLIMGKGVAGESLFWSMQSVSYLLNPPFVISVVLLLAALPLIWQWFDSPKVISAIPIVIVAGALVEFKVYAGIILLAGLIIVSLYKLITSRTVKPALLTAVLIGINMLFYLPNTQSSESLLIFAPFNLINSMIDAPDRLHWERLTIARENGNVFKFLIAEAVGLIIFVGGNLGIRILGFGSLVKLWRANRDRSIVIFISTALLVAIAMPILFIQKSTNWNTVQFFYYSLVFMTILTAMMLGSLFGKRSWRIFGLVIGIFVVLFSLPTSYVSLKDYFPDRAPARLSYNEYNALHYLRSLPAGTVLTYPYDEKYREKFAEPVPLLAYTTTAYVSAFSGKPSYFEDRMNNEIIGQDVSERVIAQKEIFKNPNADFIQDFLKKNNIRYIYVPTILKTDLNQALFGVKEIYSNSEAKIYEVR